MSRYKVIQFYPNLGTPCIVHGYDSKSEAYEDINICRNYAEVPYIAIDEKGEIFDACTFGLDRKEMAKLIEENL